MEEKVVELFEVQQSPLTARRVSELLNEDDVANVLNTLVENGTFQQHTFASDLVLYWPTHWYSQQGEKTQERVTKEKEKEKKGKEKKHEKQEKETVDEEDKDVEQKIEKEEVKTTVMAPPAQPQKVNHLATPSSSLKARLARRKRPPTPSPTNRSNNDNKTPVKESFSPASSPSPSSSPSSSPSPSPTTTTTTSANNDNNNSNNNSITDITNTHKTKENVKGSWLTTPSPKRRRVQPFSSPRENDVGNDIESLEKEKKRLEVLVASKEAQVKKKNISKGSTKVTEKEKEKEKEKDKKEKTKIVNNDTQLDAQIKKWRDGCQQMMIDLQETTKKDGREGISLKKMMDMFQLEGRLFPDFQEDSDCFG